uniref:Uncharacterized protein n=1 Tax=Arundo donax TaxID=35708 RepID=A0A0A9CBY0_ARUDO
MRKSISSCTYKPPTNRYNQGAVRHIILLWICLCTCTRNST